MRSSAGRTRWQCAPHECTSLVVRCRRWCYVASARLYAEYCMIRCRMSQLWRTPLCDDDMNSTLWWWWHERTPLCDDEMRWTPQWTPLCDDETNSTLWPGNTCVYTYRYSVPVRTVRKKINRIVADMVANVIAALLTYQWHTLLRSAQ